MKKEKGHVTEAGMKIRHMADKQPHGGREAWEMGRNPKALRKDKRENYWTQKSQQTHNLYVPMASMLLY